MDIHEVAQISFLGFLYPKNQKFLVSMISYLPIIRLQISTLTKIATMDFSFFVACMLYEHRVQVSEGERHEK